MSKKVLVCCDIGCLANNSKAVYDEFVRLSEHYEFDIQPTVKPTGCHGLCAKGPVVKIEPENINYYHVKPEDVLEIIEKTIVHNEVVERLLYYDEKSKQRRKEYKKIPFYTKQLKLALKNVGEIDPESIDDYIERGGYKALEKVLGFMSPQAVINTIKSSGLRGRGGAGFPTGTKWQSCYSYKSFPKYVVCNGDEGDPGAFMDRSVMEGDPHSVIEGMTICAFAVGAKEGYIYIRDEYGLALEFMQKAIDSAKARNYLGDNILGYNFSFNLHIVRGGGAFVCGESTALMASIEGRVGEPRAKYIRSVEKGLFNQPTVLNNVETWANISSIIINGAEWFNSIGTEKSKGTKVFSLVGKVKNTGLVEVPMGITLRELVYEIGGGILNDKQFKALQSGGPSGGCIPKEHLDLPVDFDTLTSIGSMMGSGGLIVMDERTCMVDVAKYYLNFLSEESCGKCIPCREGIRCMLDIITDITNGNGKIEDIDLLEQIANTVKEASLCGLGKSAPNPVLTTIRFFRDEYIEHIVNHRCRAGVCKKLTTFDIDKDKCKGCTRCAKVCPVGAINGDVLKPHTIDNHKCIKCGSCIDTCTFGAVRVL